MAATRLVGLLKHTRATNRLRLVTVAAPVDDPMPHRLNRKISALPLHALKVHAGMLFNDGVPLPYLHCNSAIPHFLGKAIGPDARSALFTKCPSIEPLMATRVDDDQATDAVSFLP